MIRREQVIGLLLEACPSYGARWQAYRSAPEFDAELLYVHLGDFANHVIDLLHRGENAELAALARVVEQLHLEGDDYVRLPRLVSWKDSRTYRAIEVCPRRLLKRHSVPRPGARGAASTPSGQERFRTSEPIS